ncbi:MAG: hypothetical protein NTU44_14275, partial [Bacteroidetes bacterium]|nr:hypothetical protein [Bacteroidota bacterium]
MAKKRILILLLLFQGYQEISAQVYTIGGGTNTTQYPFPTIYSDGKTQMLYTGAEILTAGYPSGAYIQRIGFNISGFSGINISDVTVSLRNYSGIQLNGFQSGLTPVFSGNYNIPASGWQDIMLQTPFLWDGSSSLVAEVCFDHLSGGTSTNVFARSKSFRVRVATASSGTGCTLTSSSSHAYLPDIRFTIAPPLPAINPFPAIGSTTQQTGLYWSSGGGYVTGYKVYFGTTNPPTTLVQDSITASFYPGVLQSNTHYYWKVVPVNPAGETANCPVWDFYTGNLTASLVAYYPFNGNANDESGYLNHGKNMGATLTFDHIGKPNNAYSFNGSSYITARPSAQLQTTSWSICGWVKIPSAPPGYVVISSKDNNQNNHYNFSTQVNPEIKISGGFETCGTEEDHLVFSSVLQNLQWYHFAYTRDNTTQQYKVYLDGVLSNSGNSTDEACTSLDSLRIGAQGYYSGSNFLRDSYFTGILDNIRIYNTALSTSQILAIYNSENCSRPSAYNVTSSVNQTSVTIGLNGSETGVSYQLKRELLNVGSQIPGDGNSLNFGTFTIPGIYYIVGTNTCGSTQMSGSATLSGSNMIVDLGPDDTICQGSSVQISATVSEGTPPYSYQWSNGAPDQPEITFNPGATASLSVTVTDASSLTATDQITVTVLPLPTVTFNTAPADQCLSSTTYTLSGGFPTGGIYSMAGPGITGDIFNASIAGNGVKTLTYSFTDVNGCSNSATNTITVNPLPAGGGLIAGPLAVTQGDQNVYYSASFIADAATYEFNYSGTGVTFFVQGNNLQISFSNDATTGILKVRGVNSCGTGNWSDGLLINVLPLNIITVTLPQIQTCAGTATIPV